jgi:small subunit ribosomal protein S16
MASMLKIRLKRVGRKHEPVYRLVVTESTAGPKSGKQVEILGSYDPRFNKVQLKDGRVKYWLSVGAKASPTAHNILVGQKIIDGKKINVLPRKSPIIKEGTAEAPDAHPVSDKKAVEAEPIKNVPPDDAVEDNTKVENKGDISGGAKQMAEIVKDAASAP